MSSFLKLFENKGDVEAQQFTALVLGVATLIIILLKMKLTRYPNLTKSFSSFPVLSTRVVASGGARPIVFITLGVSTKELPTGAHVKTRTVVDGKEVMRAYTPVGRHTGDSRGKL
jgi:hypothetical protein